MCARLIGVGPVAIQPTSDVPSHCHSGCSTRERGRPEGSTVATVAHTIRWTISTNAGATSTRRSIARCSHAPPVCARGLRRLVAAMELRTYAIRTFGCQMNEHDSLRIAELLEADGLIEAASAEEADVVVLNTCCIRENADNKLYGTLGHLKAEKVRRPDLEIVVAGCLAQKDRDIVRERAPHVDVVLGTHNVHRAAELLHDARAHGPLTEILEAAAADAQAPGPPGPPPESLEAAAADAHDRSPSALAARHDHGYAAWVTIQIG